MCSSGLILWSGSCVIEYVCVCVSSPPYIHNLFITGNACVSMRVCVCVWVYVCVCVCVWGVQCVCWKLTQLFHSNHTVSPHYLQFHSLVFLQSPPATSIYHCFSPSHIFLSIGFADLLLQCVCNVFSRGRYSVLFISSCCLHVSDAFTAVFVFVSA